MGVVMLTAALMVNERVALPVFEAESVTVTLVLTVPTAVGLPEMTPAAETLRPAGSEEPLVTAKVKPVPDPPVAANVMEG